MKPQHLLMPTVEEVNISSHLSKGTFKEFAPQKENINSDSKTKYIV